ncbi:succinic semialdehyde dehydrogenase, partial [Amycolatopsis japonica]
MTSTTPASAGHHTEGPATIGDVPGAPAMARAERLVRRVVGGADSAPVQMRAPFTGQPIATLPE